MPTKLAAQTLRILLDLIYHEKVSAPIETVFDVLLAADKYKEYLIIDLFQIADYNLVTYSIIYKLKRIKYIAYYMPPLTSFEKIQHILDATASTLRDNMNLPVAIRIVFISTIFHYLLGDPKLKF